MLTETGLESVRSEDLDRAAQDGVRHGFFTRRGGVSSGLYDSLNVGMGSDDDAAAVAENRRRIAATLGVPADRLVTVHQIHSADVVHVTAPFESTRPEADAMVTDVPGLALGVLTADCGPVLFCDGRAGVIGAAHAGWKGAFTGVLEATVDAMERLGAQRGDIVAVLGPSIGPANYEVGPEFVARFMGVEAGNERYFADSGRPGHALFDLNAYTLDRLTAAGVATGHVACCTYAQERDFYSYRRATHRQESDYGRQMSAIVLEDN